MEEKEARRILETYADMILRISYSYLRHTYDAEDICQNVILKYLSAHQRFDSREHEKAWMIRTTINACKDLRKSAFFRNAIGLDALPERAVPEEPVSVLTEELKKLPANYRISIHLFYYEGYTIKEIAQILGKRETVVANYLSRGRKRLKDSLSKDSRFLLKEGEVYD
ncbi:RNA polymerase sigma factor [Butyrivibrio sp.]|jgi:RNA polymerase sigma-70 factor (ECF subfamily)|uniref:RNA polymerase sigma factor n=1 Tax=Butyrivibrio sp. TaxID=28121 RepID=UPI0025B86FFC|nr:sigma-70 family RNA polymerase sigma factor [Butyrivibrio sp.]MBE5839581.1 sigma-70 family RNA polymerase sigma factor [Butyrivibrio sp.]